MQQEDDRFGLLLLALLAGYVVSGINGDDVARTVFLGLNIAALALALHHEAVPRWIHLPGLAGVAVLAVATAASTVLDGDGATGAVYFVAAAVEVLALLAILVRISYHETVQRNTVMGGIAAYTLLGFAFASLYLAIDVVTVETLLTAPLGSDTAVYFSFVTLTTVGYGDIVPATALAERLVVLEALIGQIFLVTLVARLVSMWGREPRTAPTRSEDPG